MSWASSELVSLLIFLLPGLVAAALFSSLTSRPKPSDFDRIFQPLIFTILIQAITAGILWCFGRKDPLNFLENGHVELLLSVGIAIVLGIVASYVLNHDWVFRILRFIRVTKETSLSPWYSSFFNNDGSYVILHLDGQRRLYGWPDEWPGLPGTDYFKISEAEWLGEGGRTPLEGTRFILVPATEVGMVEFVKAQLLDDSEN